MSDNPAGGPPRDENDPEPTEPTPPPEAESEPDLSRPSTDPAGPGPEPGAGEPSAPGPDGAGPESAEPSMPPPGAQPPSGHQPPPGGPQSPYRAPQVPPQHGAQQGPPPNGGPQAPPPYGGPQAPPPYGGPQPPPYGQQPPPYGPGGYPPPGAGYPPPPGAGYPPPAGQPLQIGDAFNYGWTKFTQNVGPILLGMLVYLVGLFVIVGIFYAILIGGATAAANSDNGGAFGAAFGIGGFVLFGIIMLLSVFVQAGIIRVSLGISRGEQISFGSFFQFQDFGKVLLAALLVGVLTGVGYALCYLPGIVFAFFAQFTLFFVIDKGKDAVEALKASFSMVNKNLGTIVLLYLGVLVANAIGSALCGVGLLVSIPVCILATTYAYRRLNNEVPV